MAEEGSESENAAPGAGDSVSAAALAAALDRAAGDAALHGHLAAFFDAQTALTRAQAHHLHVQLPRARLGTLADAFKVVLQGAVFLAVMVLVVQIGLIIADATNDYGLDIEAVAVPQWLAQRGYSGTTVAEALQGRLEAIRATANDNSAMTSNEVRGGRQETLKVEIPETGLSFEQIERFVHGYFSHSRRLTGAIVDLGNGRLAFHIAVSGAEPVSVEGGSDDVPGLLQRGAEAAFGAFDPFNTVIYLASTGRRDEALIKAEANIAHARTSHDLADALGLAGNINPDPQAMLAKGQAAVAVDPAFWGGWHDIALGSARLGHDEAALKAYRQGTTISRDAQPREMQAYFAMLVWAAGLQADKLIGDYPAALRDVQVVPESTKASAQTVVPLGKVAVLALLHDCAGADAALNFAELLHGGNPDEVLQGHHMIARCRGDWNGAIALAQQGVAQQGAGAVPRDNFVQLLGKRQVQVPLAEDLLDAGRVEEAAAVLGATPGDCYVCNRLHGRIDVARGDARNADLRFASAVRQAPSIPFAYVEWAAARLARHDAAGAQGLINEALRRSPDYPDASVVKGDIEAALGNRPAAIAAYRHASRLAPAWQLARDKAGQLARG